MKREIEERIKQQEGNSRTVFTAGGLQGRLCRSFLAIDLSDSAAEDLGGFGGDRFGGGGFGGGRFGGFGGGGFRGRR
jgi:hypothetical protein